MFAGVKDQKNSSAFQTRNETGCCIVGFNRQPQQRGDSRCDELWVVQRPQIDEDDGSCESRHEIMCYRYRNSRLANAAGADNGDATRSGQLKRQLANLVIPTDHSDRATREVGMRKLDGSGTGPVIVLLDLL